MVVIIGLLAGSGAFLLKTSVGFLSGLLTAGLNAFSDNVKLILLPLIGIVLTGIVTRYIMRQNLAHGTRQLRQRLGRGDYYLPPSLMINPIIASSITLGFGGSAGSEGPIATAGGAIGGNLGRWARLSPQTVLLLIGCGAGAGIAGIFKAPVGGALFTLELMNIPLTSVGVIALFVCTSVAAMTAYALSGFTLDLTTVQTTAHFDGSLIPFIIAFGVICGLYSLYYNFFMKRVALWLGHLRNPWIKNIIAGSALGLLIYVFPALYGEGYGVVGQLLNGHSGALLADGPFAVASGGVILLMLVSVGILLVKSIATSDTNSGGGVAGDFAPTLFAGGVLGFLFAVSLNHFCGFDLPVGLFTLYGMAGVMAGAIRAPLMAWMLVVEMVGDYYSFMPVFIISVLSFGVVRLFTFDSFYQHRPDRPNGILSRLHRLF